MRHGRLIITHGFIKKEAWIKPEEIDRMKRIRDEYEKEPEKTLMDKYLEDPSLPN